MAGKTGPETRLVKKMRDEAQRVYGKRIVIIKQHGGPYAEAGVSDLICCLDGRFVAVEVKAPESYGGSVSRAVEEGPTTKQWAFMRRIGATGGTAVVCATVDAFMDVLAEVSRNGGGDVRADR